MKTRTIRPLRNGRGRRQRAIGNRPAAIRYTNCGAGTRRGSGGAIRSPEVRQPFTAFTDVAADAKKVNASLKLLWTGCGRDDGLFTPNKD